MNQPVPTDPPPDPDFEAYLSLLTKLLRVPRHDRQAITEELRGHLREAYDDLLHQGQPPVQALRLAIDDLGDAAVLASRLTDISRSCFHRRFLMRVAVPSAVIVTAVLMLSIAFAPIQHQQPLSAPSVTGQTPQPETRDAKPLDTVVEHEVAAKLQAALQKRVVVEFTETPLREVLEFVADQIGVDILMDFSELGEERPVTLKLPRSKPTAETVLKLVLESTAGRDHRFSIRPRDGFIEISQGEPELETCVYNCRDLLSSLTDQRRQQQAAPVPPVAGSADGGRDPVLATPGSTSFEGAALLTTLEINIPGPWQVSGGVGTMTEFNGLVIINQTSTIHRRIESLLDKMRLAHKERDHQPATRR